MIIDVLEVLLDYLLTKTELTNLVSTRIFGNGLPPAENSHMPRKCVVIREHGGIERNDEMPLLSPRMHIRSYGETSFAAGQVDRAVYTALKAVLRVTQSSTILHSVGLGRGATSGVDPDTGWEYKDRLCTVHACS